MANPPNPYAAPQSDLWPAGKSNPGDIAFDDAPIGTFRCVLDAKWFERGYSRWARAHASSLAAWVSLFVLAGGVALLALLSFPNKGAPPFGVRLLSSMLIGGVAALPFLVGWVLNRWSIWWIAMRQFHSSKDFGAVCHFTLYREGVATSSPTTVTARRWNGFLSARRFSDGILVLLDFKQFYWLPWTDLILGKPDDVHAILQASLTDYKEMRA